MYLLGIDVGSSSVKASVIKGDNGEIAGSSFFPKHEMVIDSPRGGWAEQHPDEWWKNLKLAIREAVSLSGISGKEIGAIGISYQMHGLVVVDKDKKVLRPSIIWCDSRATEIGRKAFIGIGEKECLESLLNSPGNFTASKLKWVKDNEPELYAKIDKIMLPGDYIAAKLTGEVKTTVSGLSEGIFWDFRNREPADFLLNELGLDKSLLAEITPVFGRQGSLTVESAALTGLKTGTPVCYRAGDQPNNAFSLNVLNPGEIAATAGTSGVVYGVSDQVKFDPKSRVNTFVHVNSLAHETRNGILLCVNGTGSLNSWIKKLAGESLSYSQMNEMAATVNPGADGLLILPFGNGV